MEGSMNIRASKYIGYLLRHNPEDLEMDDEGFVDLNQLISKVRVSFPLVDKETLENIVDQSERKRFEIVGDKIRALYGHTVNVHIRFAEDKSAARLYHGTTPQAAQDILETGLRPMRRRWIHLSPTAEVARELGKRRTDTPVVLVIDAAEARNHGTRFYMATNKVYLCKYIPAKYIKLLLI